MKRLVLAGGGHAHLQVLGALARAPLAGWQVDLVTPHPSVVYSGMLPGWLAGHYTLDQCTIDLRPLAARAGVALQPGSIRALDAGARMLTLEDGTVRAFDLLSLNTGSAPPDASPAFGATTSLRPIERFVAGADALMATIATRCTPVRVVIAGAGAGGVELALALRHRGMREGWSHLHVTLLGTGPEPMASAPPRVRRRVAGALRRMSVAWRGNTRLLRAEPGVARLADGTTLPCDACWLVTGPRASPWLAQSGLALDAEGFAQVDATLRSVSHPHVFAAGDIASHPARPPRSGVYAVRAGQALARNLPRVARGEPAHPWEPQARALYLVSTGGRRVIATWGHWSTEGAWAWHWKDWIDRRFVHGWH
jgi:pyridine nucleotide-disulfide oxidoreductase family protein